MIGFRQPTDDVDAALTGRPRPRPVMIGIWLAFVVFPLVDAAATPGDLVHRILTIVFATLFVAGYVVMVALWRFLAFSRTMIPVLGAMLALASVLTLTVDPGWGYLYSYCAACSAFLPGDTLVVIGVVLSGALGVGVPAIAGANGGAALGLGASAAGVGLIMVLVRDVRLRNAELLEARAELATLAVAQERERFARDLHDLLGHTLSVIAIKAELAGRLLPRDPQRAAAEVADVESVARKALGDVREAVSGYRRPTLEGELAGARMALNAAGVECEIDGLATALEPEAEAVLAWAVREGATNVIRHSQARRCLLRLTAGADAALLEVVDDGCGAAAGAIGNGLAGLRERARAVSGTLSAGPEAGGGYRLAVSVPSDGART